ncbi:MAG TPA: shikimate dehydrogenase [Flexivirga sp.]|uniref:shikimate dehydrogenase n=1 Tax=Flexivirga sp. TaxID=1962927 RepID=UPI002BFA4C01|nr:shikimate dehydrogenase [Flexivirga sp.]HWC22027.1 shikimate dehydrogenase [Flexivirga sp.]
MVQASSRQVLTRHRAAVLGKPIAHSMSPVLHRAAYEARGMADWSYDVRECDAASLRDLIAGLGPTWRGLSLTMPLKEEALLIADTASDVALRTGAVNTLIRTGRGWHGENTDVIGIREALRDAGVAAGALPRAVVVGSGATARSALAALADLRVPEVIFVVRKDVRASTLAQARDHGFRVVVLNETEGAAAVLEAPLTISTIPAGAADSLAGAMSELGVAASATSPTQRVLLDVVYADWPTELAATAAAYGARIVPGIEMLIHQGAAQFQLMTGSPAPLEVMQRAGRAAALG